MEACCHTWTYPQLRPFQIHHDDHADPVGRITSGKYIPYVPTGSDSVSEVSTLFQDAASKQDMLDAAQMLEETGVLSAETWKGVGEMRLEAIITDSDAIEKILDGRYQGISITQRPRQALCSICGTDWVKESCTHSRGVKDEETGRTMYLVVGDTTYDECSAVNRPADGHAKIESAEFIDSSPPAEGGLGVSTVPSAWQEATVVMRLLDSVQENEEPVPPDQADVPGEAPVAAQTEPTPDEAQPAPVPDPIEEALRTLFEDEGNFTEEMAERLNEELEGEVEEQDAKLSTEKRKALAPSTFCGPKKSFPVPDCAHVTAARRLIGRYKGEGSKEAILACVSRKAKALGCDKGKDETPPEGRDTMMCLDCLSDGDLQQKYLEVEQLMAARGLKVPRECLDCSEKQAQLDELNAKIPEMDETVRVLRQEWKTVTSEHVLSERAHAVTAEKLLGLTREYAALVLSLTQRERTLDEIRTQVEGADLESLTSLMAVSTSECVDFVRSGLARQPVEAVTPEDATPEEVVDVADETRYLPVAERLVDWASRYGEAFAEKHCVTYIAKGELPVDFTLAKLRALMAK
jgi:hypothetical protein